MGRRLSSAEITEEAAWLLDGGMPAFMVCESLGRSPGAMVKATWRSGRNDLSHIFSSLEAKDRRIRESR